MQSRKGFVPAEEKIRREVQDFESRESQLRDERKKSYPDIVALLDSPEERCVPVCSAKSLTQLNCLEIEHIPAPGSLKAAKSLAELCDLDDEDVEAHRSLTLIKQFENLIQKHNQQART